MKLLHFIGSVVLFENPSIQVDSNTSVRADVISIIRKSTKELTRFLVACRPATQ